jgi:hypothetical protein
LSTPTHPLLAELATVKNYLSAAQDVLKSGYMPDITALEGRVQSLCEQIQKASKEIHEQCLPELIEVLEQLNRCETEMKLFHEARVKAGTAS